MSMLQSPSLETLPVPSPHKVPSFVSIRDTSSVIAELRTINTLVAALANQNSAFNGNSGTRAYVTFCTPSYYFGLIGLVRSLRRFSEIPLICLVDAEFNTSLMDFDNVYFVQVPRLINSSYQPGRQEFSNVLSKLWVFGLTSIDKIVFLDSDVSIVKPVDEIFDYNSPSFAPDYVDHVHTQRFNSGVFVICPSAADFRQLINFACISESYDGGDQGILNNYYAGRHSWLPRAYNTIRHAAYYQDKVMIKSDEPVIIHFIVKKPWEIKYREACDSFLVDLESKWTEALTKDDLLKLITHWRKEVFIVYEREMQQSDRKRLRKINRAIRTSIGINAGGLLLIAILSHFNIL